MNKMLCWACYYLGDLCYKILDVLPDRPWLSWWHSGWYRPYNWLMNRSYNIQDRTGCNGPWGMANEPR